MIGQELRAFPINRCCPYCEKSHADLLVNLPAHAFCSVNRRYRKDFSDILGID